MKNRRKLRALLVGSLVFLVMFGILDLVACSVSRLRLNAIMSVQSSVYATLQESVRDSNGKQPSNFSPIPVEPQVYYLKDVSIYYYPKAWGKTGGILLRRRWGTLHSVTFGDGSQALVAFWSCVGSRETGTEPNLLSSTGAEKFNYYIYFVPPLGIAAIALSLFLVKASEREQ